MNTCMQYLFLGRPKCLRRISADYMQISPCFRIYRCQFQIQCNSDCVEIPLIVNNSGQQWYCRSGRMRGFWLIVFFTPVGRICIRMRNRLSCNTFEHFSGLIARFIPRSKGPRRTGWQWNPNICMDQGDRGTTARRDWTTHFNDPHFNPRACRRLFMGSFLAFCWKGF
jgi:hypothetical protein